MTTATRWNKGPWATLGLGTTEPATTNPVTPYAQLESGEPLTGSGGWGGPARGEPPGYGPYGSTFSNLADAAASVLTGNPVRAAIPVASMIARYYGAPSYANPFAGLPSDEEIALEQERDPNKAARMSAERETGLAKLGQVYGKTQANLEAEPNPGNVGGGVDTSANPEAGGYAGLGMGAPGGYGDEFAKGGVVRTTGKHPFQAILGERGPETGVFIPKTMEQPGVQGNEMQVMRALLQTLARLKGRG